MKKILFAMLMFSPLLAIAQPPPFQRDGTSNSAWYDSIRVQTPDGSGIVLIYNDRIFILPDSTTLGSNAAYGAYVGTYGATNFNIFSNRTQRMRIRDDGGVGIGNNGSSEAGSLAIGSGAGFFVGNDGNIGTLGGITQNAMGTAVIRTVFSQGFDSTMITTARTLPIYVSYGETLDTVRVITEGAGNIRFNIYSGTTIGTATDSIFSSNLNVTTTNGETKVTAFRNSGVIAQSKRFWVKFTSVTTGFPSIYIQADGHGR